MFSQLCLSAQLLAGHYIMPDIRMPDIRIYRGFVWQLCKTNFWEVWGCRKYRIFAILKNNRKFHVNDVENMENAKICNSNHIYTAIFPQDFWEHNFQHGVYTLKYCKHVPVFHWIMRLADECLLLILLIFVHPCIHYVILYNYSITK